MESGYNFFDNAQYKDRGKIHSNTSLFSIEKVLARSSIFFLLCRVSGSPQYCTLFRIDVTIKNYKCFTQTSIDTRFSTEFELKRFTFGHTRGWLNKRVSEFTDKLRKAFIMEFFTEAHLDTVSGILPIEVVQISQENLIIFIKCRPLTGGGRSVASMMQILINFAAVASSWYNITPPTIDTRSDMT